ncbi:CDP-glucose 4,6-dehydratase [Leptothermofonsia sp. ETS-13]|uniref:CDP-glucose 4,6-dehydratase n=1 Tax=Leptothermofonsia sp. ETS-13 TaxID=3035696 RepID=UPI003BA0625C
MNLAFWQGRKVLITGHTGFKGSWLSVWLQMHKTQVVGYALEPPTQPNLFEIAQITEGMTSIYGDIRDLEHFQAVMKEHQPEILIHMAAQSIVRSSYEKPVETFAVNVMGTVHVLEVAARTKSVRAVLMVTSDKCYENREWVWGYRENEALGGFDPYSSSKSCAELVIQAYWMSFFPPHDYDRHRVAVASARAGNVIGGGDWAKDRLIPDIMRSIEAGEPVLIRNPIATRPWQHVLVPLSGYLTLIEYLWDKGAEYAEAWNFGPADEDVKPVAWIVDHLTREWGKGARWELDQACHPYEDTYLKLDCSKARSRLRWSPKISIETALEWIIEFYQVYFAGGDVRAVMEAQIRRYEMLSCKDNGPP